MQPADIRLMHDGETEVGQDATVVPKALSTARTPSHTVRFYENETFLSHTVADLIAEGLAAGEPAVIIATQAHRQAFSLHLEAKGFDMKDACCKGQLTVLDAQETLSTFIVGLVPDSQRFRTVIGKILESGRRESGQSVVRVYGEMVDLLWKGGNVTGAIRLEELWNDIADTYAFTLLCAYAIDNFETAESASGFDEICRQHTHVLPTERYTQASEKARLVEISMLQQRAQALESEVKHRKALEQQVRVSLAEREQLLKRERAARADAEAANRTKATFLATMSHELRTPLNAIGGYTDLIAMEVRGPITEEQRHDLARIRHSQQHLLALINDLLHYAKLEAGQVEYNLTDIALASLFARVEELTNPQFGAKHVACSFVNTPLFVRADADKLCQILVNLLSNAVKFTKAGGSVTVSATCDGQERVCISVQDTGMGISPEYLTSIFDPFVQAGRSSHATADGVGLGLAISRDLARGMHGDLAVMSELGSGSTFILTVPSAQP